MSTPFSSLQRLRMLLFPSLSHEVEREIDKEAIRSISYSSFAVFMVEVVSLVFYLATRASLAIDLLMRMASECMCCVLCLAGYLTSKYILKQWPRDHHNVMFFKVFYFVTLSAWGIFESARNYAIGNQMLTFFTVEFLMTAFLVVKPWLSALLVGGAYSALYAVLFAIDGAARVNTYSYAVFMLVTIAGMMVRFHVQRDVTRRAIKLEYVSTHDDLTSLLNRKALEEDVKVLVDEDLVFRMADVNHFKTFNDTYGHLTGDIVLKETAVHLQRMYPGARLYRFGGDEFLIINEQSDPEGYSGDVYGFECVSATGETVSVTLSVGVIKGTPHDRDGLFTLINWSDQELYRVKERVHQVRE